MRRLVTLHLLVPAAVAFFGMALIVVGHVRTRQQLSEQAVEELRETAYREGTRLSHISQHLLRKGLQPATDLEMSYLGISPHLVLGVICDGRDVVRHATRIQWRGVPLAETPLKNAVPRLSSIRNRIDGESSLFTEGGWLWAIFPYLERTPGETPVVVLAYDLEAPRREAARLALHESISQSFGLLGGCVLLWLVLDGLITRRIGRILLFAQQVGSGRNPAVPVRGQDEIGAVGRAFAEAVRQLRTTEKQLLQASERERWKLGMDLHDDVCQRIAAAQLKSGVLAAALKREDSPLQKVALQVAQELADAAEIARGQARGLAPVTLDRDGLNAALRDMTAHVAKAFNVPVGYESTAEVQRLPDDIQVHLFRIAQELVTNAAKHGKAGFIAASISLQEGKLVLKVENDGRRFEPNKVSQGGGMGLTLVQQRVRALNGRLLFLEREDEGGGSVALCEIPISGRLDHELQSRH